MMGAVIYCLPSLSGTFDPTLVSSVEADHEHRTPNCAGPGASPNKPTMSLGAVALHSLKLVLNGLTESPGRREPVVSSDCGRGH
jgi:hypothetical protein